VALAPSRSDAEGALALGATTWTLFGQGNAATSHVIRSHRHHPVTTCNLSVDVPYFRGHVHGRPWSSVIVDVPTDVDWEDFRSELGPAVCLLPDIWF
jgi:hypothetical protein